MFNRSRTRRRRSQRSYPKKYTPVTENSNSVATGKHLNEISVGRFKSLPTLWPDKMMMKMKFIDTVTVSADLLIGQPVVANTWTVNSLFSPGYLPNSANGFPELAAMYSRYRVLSSNTHVNLSNIYGITTYTAVLTITPDIPTTNLTYAQMLNLIGNPYTVWASGGKANSQDATCELETYCKHNKLFGSKNYDTDLAFAGTRDASPVNQVKALLVIGTPATDFGPPPYNFDKISITCQIEFWCEWFQRDFEQV